MAEETLVTPPPPQAAEVAVVSNVPEPETCEKEAVVPVPEPEPVKYVAVEDDTKVTSTESFKEETNVVGELPDPQKIALDELKKLVQEALNKHEFTAPAAEEEKSSPVEQTVKCKEEDKDSLAAETAASESAEKQATDEDGAKKIEALEETIVKTEQPAAETPVEPEEVSIWGIPLLADDRSDVILLKFLRARDFKVKEALNMLKNVVAWRKEFEIESLIEEDLGSEKEKVVYMHGVDKEGHPVCYNAFAGETFTDEEKRKQFIRWRIQFLEKSIRNLDFSPDGISTIVQVNDLKYSPAPFKKELRQVFQLFQDNYPEFVARQVWLKILSLFFTVKNTFLKGLCVSTPLNFYSPYP